MIIMIDAIKIRLLAVGLTLILLLFVPVSKAFAGSVLLQDDFNDGNSNGWDVIGNSGWNVQNGEYGILLNPGLSNTVPNDSLWNYGWTNISFEVDLRGVQGVDKNILVKFKDASNFVELHANSQGIFLEKGAPGGGMLASSNTILSNNTLYHFKFEMQDTGNIKVYKDNVLLFDVNEPSPLITNWKIGLRAGTGGNPVAEVWFDNVVVKSLDPVPTPTPTPSVILVPGMGASWNADALLNCKSDGYDGGWSMSAFAADIYGPLVSALNGAGINVSVFNYDWRKEIPDNQPGLRGFIDGLGGKFSLVGHSMGGLLGRAYLESAGNNSKLTDLITVGSPHRGSALAYPVWSAGEIWDRSPLTKIAATLLLKRCGSTKRTDKQVIQTYWPSVHNLLPIDNYLRDINSGNLIPVDSMAARNNWQPTNFLSYGVHVGTLSGVSMDTLQNIPVKDRSKIDAVLGDWEDGKLMGKEMTSQGDGVVLASNAILLGADNRSISGTHLGIVSSADGVNQILNLLGITTSATQAVWQEPKSALVVIGNNARLILTDPKGKIRSDSNGVTSVINPATGNYKYFLVPKKFQSELIVIQVKNNGDVLYNEYKFNDFLPKFGTIEF